MLLWQLHVVSEEQPLNRYEGCANIYSELDLEMRTKCEI